MKTSNAINLKLLSKMTFYPLLLVCISAPVFAVDEDIDGVLDIAEGSVDTDLDGVENYRDIDADNDGILDSQESGGLGDGSATYPDFKEYRADVGADYIAFKKQIVINESVLIKKQVLREKNKMLKGFFENV